MTGKRTWKFLCAGVLALGLLGAGGVPSAEVPGPSPLRLRSTSVGVGERVDGALVVLRIAPGQLAGVRSRLRQHGVTVLADLPDDALLVERDAVEALEVPGLIATEPWTAARAITPELARSELAAGASCRAGVPILVGVATEAELGVAAARLRGPGVQVSWIEPAATPPQLGIVAEPARLPDVLGALGSLDGLVWADVQPPIRMVNDASVWRCQSGQESETPLYDHGLDGQGEVVGIMDTGIDIDHCAFRDGVVGLPALNGHVGVSIDPTHRKVLAVDFYWQQDWPIPGPYDWDDQGHGSHVAGSVAGDAGADGQHEGYDGMAPAAKLVIQDGGFAFDDCADLPGLGCPVRPLEPVLQQAYDQGARIHSDSWGDEENFLPRNRYTERAADVDRFVWNHPDMAVFFAAGNAGQEGDDTVISPATAKNVVAVGATSHGDIEPPCPVDWSSHGWTHDGRIKPDVMAPGSNVVSAESDLFIGSDNCGYAPKSGTSMATPTVAGLAAMVRQYFVDGFYRRGSRTPAAGFVPSAALVKAMLIASAVDLTDLGCVTTEPVPSRSQGWGLVQLDRALLFGGESRRLLVVDERDRFEGSGDAPLRRELVTGEPGPLKVVLVWTDPPSTSVAAVNLINDLDLLVTGAEGTLHGNHLVDGISQVGGDADRLNNVEVVWLPYATPGDWTIEVRPHAIREAGQGLALVVLSPSAVAEVRHVRRRLAP
jgi:hypothetical protein